MIDYGVPLKKIALWIPVYNESKYIRQTLDSVVNQTSSDFDIIVSDNHSTDDSRSIIEEFIQKGANIELWSPPSHLLCHEHGLWAWDRLRRLDYQGFINIGGHDVISPRYVELLIEAWAKNPNAAVVSGKAYSLSEDNRTVAEYSIEIPQLIGPARIFNPFSILSITGYNAAAFGLIPMSIVRGVKHRYHCVGVDILFLAEASVLGDIVCVRDAKIYCHINEGQSGQDSYYRKHLGLQLKSAETTNQFNLQLKYVSEIADVAFADYPEEMRNIYRASLLGCYVSRRMQGQLGPVEGALEDWLGCAIGSTLLGQLNFTGDTIGQMLTNIREPAR